MFFLGSKVFFFFISLIKIIIIIGRWRDYLEVFDRVVFFYFWIFIVVCIVVRYRYYVYGFWNFMFCFKLYECVEGNY